MNVSMSVGKSLKNALLDALVDFGGTHTFKCILMRPNWSFSQTNHLLLANVFTATVPVLVVCDGTAKTITRASGSFVTDGFVSNNYITTDGTNAGTYRITSVTATVLKIALVGAATFVDDPSTSTTITSDDEMTTAEGGGYLDTAGVGFALTFTITDNVLTLDPIDLTATGDFKREVTSDDIALIYDITHASDLIVCALRFASWRLNV